MRHLLLLAALGCACGNLSDDLDTWPDDADTGDEDGLCPWVAPVPAQSNCVATIGAADAPIPVVVTYNELGLEVEVWRSERDIETRDYDARGRVSREELPVVTEYDWLGCFEYMTESFRDGDLIEDASVRLRDTGEVDSRTSRRYFGGLVTNELSYTTTWADERIESATWRENGDVGRTETYTYGSDSFGDFQSYERRDATNDVTRATTTWVDLLGRVVRFARLNDEGQPIMVIATEYDGDGVDATSTQTTDQGADGGADSVQVTTFLADGRIDQVETFAAGGSSVVLYRWECGDR